jgi:taurine dioxygenase
MQISNLSTHTGTEVHGIDLRDPLDTDTLATLRRLFSERSVLVMRKQSLQPADLLQAVELFGEVFEQQNTRFSLPECPQIHYLSNEDRYPDGQRYIPGSGYHTDHSNEACPPKATALHAVELPSSGGDTQFANMQMAYAALPTKLKTRVDGLRAVHVYQSHLSKRKLMGLTAERQQRVAQPMNHPLVRKHPETDKPSIYINPIRIERIEGYDEQQTVALLEQLLAHATQAQFEYRHKWQHGDLVLWDNRCLLHKANGDYDMSERRYMYRVMLRGDAPR